MGLVLLCFVAVTKKCFKLEYISLLYIDLLQRVTCIVWRAKNDKSEKETPDKKVPIPELLKAHPLLDILKNKVKHYSESRKKRLKNQMKLTPRFRALYNKTSTSKALEV